ncbi:SAM-dependent methyltransferase [Actinopolymorpha pittospori]|uniref:Cyclopropane fatty-acyl-phospholipid synthase-like methyltransferase n=1 Tax=Actinopolymorpha pittospori TaxID=648752 RepID=A0A927RBQ4_9ACTN|nr:methyltransferase domain-containing protein [Actinopolymorpha pittospori]MBE1606315.1 cyclopropane fatty-acyl-phospholipid synthase-like methyltransferase [Actinopolymorpha pittospori]
MPTDIEELRRQLVVEAFPRAATYDATWVMTNQMGPNALWLAESLGEVLPLEAGSRVLDLGCGRGLTSVFLAREFGVEVWAVDLWVSANDNWQRVQEAGLAGRVHPIHAEAHTLPFAEGFFDAAVSFDAYQYFGTDDLYLGYLSRFVKPGGQIGIVVPALGAEPDVFPPPHLAPYWDWDMCCWHSPSWWRRHWEKTGLVEVDVADLVPEGWDHWLRWETVVQRAWTGEEEHGGLLRADADQRLLGFTRLVARRAD